jgi:biotin transport system substrate-specific component
MAIQPTELSQTKMLVKTTLVALFAAFIAGGTFIAVPLPFSPIPVVLQNFFALLSGIVLGPAMGTLAVGLYLGVGALGFPVFAGAKGGIVHFFGPTGGYLVGYLIGTLLAGAVMGRPRTDQKNTLARLLVAVLVGIIGIYIPGLLRLKMVLNAGWTKTISAGLLPFIVGDLIKGAIILAVAPRLRRIAARQLES